MTIITLIADRLTNPFSGRPFCRTLTPKLTQAIIQIIVDWTTDNRTSISAIAAMLNLWIGSKGSSEAEFHTAKATAIIAVHNA
jgi:hypothetical protein